MRVRYYFALAVLQIVMKKTAAIILFFIFFSFPLAAQGANFWGKAEELVRGTGGDTGLSSDITTPVGSAVSAVLAAVGVIFFFLTCYAGFLWLTAAGREEQAGKAKKILEAALIGMSMVFAAYAITFFVTGRAQKISSEAMTLPPTDGGAGGAPTELNCGEMGGACVSLNENNRGTPCDPDGLGDRDPYTGADLGMCDRGQGVCCQYKDSAGDGRLKCETAKKGLCVNECGPGVQDIGDCDIDGIDDLECCK